jgi:predicted SnoaL-like aldol condensation-catalyzing enzyme
MSTEARHLVEDFYAAGGPVGDPAGFPALFHPEYVSHTSPPGMEPGVGQADSLREWLTSVFSDVEYELVRLVAEGDLVAAHTFCRGTHTGHGLGIEPTGRRWEAEQMHIIRVADGKIAEHWGVRDDAGMMRQLTAVPQPA